MVPLPKQTDQFLSEQGDKRGMLDFILEQTKSPVARARLLSGGLHKNHRLEKGSGLCGDAGCLACGNCIDNCPVIRDQLRFVTLQNQRTSMALETLVGDSCRRCYRCINACPQVGKAVKEYALAFRRGEKVIHLLTAAAIIGLAGSGITLSHWGYLLPALEAGILSWVHRGLGVLLTLIPVAFWIVDRKHMRGILRKITDWGPHDWQWICALIRHIAAPQKNEMPSIYQFNPAQKFWGAYLFFVMLPALAISGFGQWYGLCCASDGAGTTAAFALLHMTVALTTDLLLFLHIYFKYIRGFLRTAYEMAICFIRHGHFMYWTLYDSGAKPGPVR
jgi:cytochrome b subunit of formate dehydrogenase